MGTANLVFGPFELPVHRQAVMHDHTGVADQHPGIADGLHPACCRGVDQIPSLNARITDLNGYGPTQAQLR